MRLFKGKLGTDKPIEIFIALFVILAVAMVILKMFSSQIEQKKTEMEQQQQEERARQAMSDLDTYCDTQCSKAFRSLKDKVAYCTSYYRGEIDINKNSMPDYTMALDNIQGFCEDRIFCAAYRPCGSLDIKNCKTLVCRYLDETMSLGTDYDQASRLVGYDDGIYNGLFQPGECWYRLSDQEKKYHWFNNFLRVEDPLGTTCSLLVGTCYDKRGEFEADPDFSAWLGDGTWEQECVIFE